MSAADDTPITRPRLSRIPTSVPDAKDFAWQVLDVFRLRLGSVLLAAFLVVTNPHIAQMLRYHMVETEALESMPQLGENTAAVRFGQAG